MNTEPVAVVGGLTQLVTAVIALLIGFDVVEWTETQVGLVLGVWAAITALVLIFWVRQQVSPVNKGDGNG